MADNKQLSNSEFQLGIERVIIQEMIALNKMNISVEELKSGSKNIRLGNKKTEGKETSFQVDFYNFENNIIGEIYTCGTKLLSGHKRKIAMDALKLITIEKIINQKFKKYIILAMPSIELPDPKSMENKLINQADFKDVSPLGKDSWILRTAEMFKIEIWYYFLDGTMSQKLIEKRKNQKEGIKK